ncbi:MAG: hypothetical protein V3T23_09190 [Nitrososphaerales archaeon]
MTEKIDKSSLAFGTEGVLRDRKYLDSVRDMDCIVTGRSGSDYETVDPAHIGTAGKGFKSADNHVLPLIHSEHLKQHAGEHQYWLNVFAKDKYLLTWFLKSGAEKLYREREE